jgi:hypothetical protein
MQIVIRHPVDSQSTPLPKGNIPFSTIDRGEGTEIERKKAQACVIDTPGYWTAVINKMGTDPEYTSAVNVDFNNQIVLVFFAGQKGTGGGSLEITSIQGNSALLQMVVNVNYTPGILDVVTYPWIMVVVKKYRLQEVLFLDRKAVDVSV